VIIQLHDVSNKLRLFGMVHTLSNTYQSINQFN